MEINTALFLVLLGGALALGYAFLKTRWIYAQQVEHPVLQEVSGYIAQGAMAFMSREYKVLSPFVLAVALFLALGNQGALRWQGAAFLLGCLASGLAGLQGMRVATAANARTAQAAKDRGLGAALHVAFSGGSVMGMSVVGLALLGLFLVFYLSIQAFGQTEDSLRQIILPLGTAFSLGASSIALFSRVGGGIFTKAADVGADLVGKVEAGIPEDDPRNPATIADNVGDNVGDVAGMGADLFESYVGSIVGAMILGMAVPASPELRLKLMLLPLLIAAVGILASVLGTFLVRASKSDKPQRALNAGTLGAAGLATVLVFLLMYLLLGEGTDNQGVGLYRVFGATVTGLVAGVIIGQITEYYTGTNKRPVREIVSASETGSATTIISGIGVGMRSAFPTVLVIAAGIYGSYWLAGLYGVGVAAVGMLMTLGIQLAVDAYGPIADNAGGLAEMAELPRGVRKITDSLDAVGNTTAAIGKGFAIGSAALTAIILLSSFRDQAGLLRVDITSADVLVGVLIGGVIPFLFSALAMGAVGKAAHEMIAEVRRQFRTMPGILTGEEKPDYRRCIDISTRSALREMLAPGLIALITPVLVGFLGGIAMLIGLLTGVTVAGVALAIFLSNAGGAWDNAKKMAESDDSLGKGSEAYKAAVVGDTVGDPFKDTAGPALNILIKLMSMVSLVIAPMLQAYWG
ncbi:MAG: sodium-translocating pyrophosphatase [Clostridiales bacterium]|nr:sodium-translocating pyrophosphatase [Clostridiales bacterium]